MLWCPQRRRLLKGRAIGRNCGWFLTIPVHLSARYRNLLRRTRRVGRGGRKYATARSACLLRLPCKIAGCSRGAHLSRYAFVRCDLNLTDSIEPGYYGGLTPSELALSTNEWRNGCFAEYACFPAENAHLLDEQLLEAQGIQPNQLAEIASLMPGMGAANAISFKAGDTVLALPATGFFSSSGVAAVLALGADVIAGSRDKESLDALIQHFSEDSKRLTPIVLSGDILKDTASLRTATPGGKRPTHTSSILHRQPLSLTISRLV